jgi:hypothetical protein
VCLDTSGIVRNRVEVESHLVFQGKVATCQCDFTWIMMYFKSIFNMKKY